MGWRLVEEILDHCPDLRYREFRALIALAVDARDETRRAMPGAETVARRANCRERAAYTALASLRDRGLIRTASGSAPGHRAVYEIPPVAETAATMRAGERKPKGRHRRARTPAHMHAPETPADMRAPDADNACTQGDTRTPADMRAVTPADMRAGPPSYPSVTPSFTGAETAPTAQGILAAFIDWDRANRGQLTKRTIGQLAKQITALLAEGVDDRHIRQGLADWRARGQHPSTLDSFVSAAMNGHPPKSRRQQETDDQFARAMARARARETGARGELT